MGLRGEEGEEVDSELSMVWWKSNKWKMFLKKMT